MVGKIQEGAVEHETNRLVIADCNGFLGAARGKPDGAGAKKTTG